MYNPQIKYACDMVRQIHDAHMAEIAFIELIWERVYNGTLDSGEPKLVQLVPTVITQAKG